MNLPHTKPVLFAKKILCLDEDYAKVLCEFPFNPSFGMILESAAQSSSAFAKEKKNAFLAGINNAQKFKNFDKTSFEISIKKLFSADNMELFSFEVEGYASGRFTIYVK